MSPYFFPLFFSSLNSHTSVSFLIISILQFILSHPSLIDILPFLLLLLSFLCFVFHVKRSFFNADLVLSYSFTKLFVTFMLFVGLVCFFSLISHNFLSLPSFLSLLLVTIITSLSFYFFHRSFWNSSIRTLKLVQKRITAQKTFFYIYFILMAKTLVIAYCSKIRSSQKHMPRGSRLPAD